MSMIRLLEMCARLGGGRATITNLERVIEMGNMPVSKNQDVNRPVKGNLEASRGVANLLFPTTARESPFRDNPDRQRVESSTANDNPVARVGMGHHNDSTDSGVSTGGQPQQIRSMLDV